MLYQLSYSRLISSKETVILNPEILSLRSVSVQSGESRIRTYEGIRQQIYSLPQLAALVSPQSNRKKLLRHTFTNLSRADEGIRTPDLQITNQLL
jgi:hypothetical protein